MGGKLYHMGFPGKVARSTLAEANESRDWRIFADFAQVLIAVARPLYADDPIGVDLDASLYALDSTTIDLCLSLFSWARFRRHKAALKLHTLLDLHGNIPAFIGITDGKMADVRMLDEIVSEAGAFYVMDRGYIDFERLYVFSSAPPSSWSARRGMFWLQRRYSHEVDKSTGVCSDHTVILTVINSIKVYPDALRRVSYVDPETNKRFRASYQQLRLTRTYHRPDLQVALASGTLLQMDQAASADQGILRPERERSEDSDLDRRVGLRARCHRPQAPAAGCEPLPDSTDSQPIAF